MIIVAHRRNLIEQLAETPSDQGVEVDIRSDGGRLVIHHDPFAGGVDFEEWLAHYRHRLLILNVKEEGLEAHLQQLMKSTNIEDYFFLDQSFPFLVRTARAGDNRCAVRVSEFESIETAYALTGLVKWVWVDCFTKFPIRGDEAARLEELGFSLCIVSPELQGRDPHAAIPAMRETLAKERIRPAAVCTKQPALWA